MYSGIMLWHWVLTACCSVERRPIYGDGEVKSLHTVIYYIFMCVNWIPVTLQTLWVVSWGVLIRFCNCCFTLCSICFHHQAVSKHAVEFRWSYLRVLWRCCHTQLSSARTKLTMWRWSNRKMFASFYTPDDFYVTWVLSLFVCFCYVEQKILQFFWLLTISLISLYPQWYSWHI